MPCGDQHKYFHLFRYLKRRMSLLNCLTSSTRCWSRRLVRGKWAEIIFSRFWHLSGLAWSWSSPRFYFLSIQLGPLLIFPPDDHISNRSWSSMIINLQDQPLRDQGAWLGDDVRTQSSSQGGRKLSAYWGETVKWKRLLKRERMVEKLFQKNVLKFLKLFSRWPSTRCRTASAPSPSLTLSFWSR